MTHHIVRTPEKLETLDPGHIHGLPETSGVADTIRAGVLK